MTDYDRESLSEMFKIDRLLIGFGFSISDTERLTFNDYHSHYLAIVNKRD